MEVKKTKLSNYSVDAAFYEDDCRHKSGLWRKKKGF